MISQTNKGRRSDKYINVAPVRYEEVISLKSLKEAYAHCRKGKSAQPRFLKFAVDAPLTLSLLHRQLKRGTYVPNKPFVFEIYCQSGRKTRLISSPCIRDAVVQHAIYLKIQQELSRHFIFDSYGCLLGKGTHRASLRCQHFVRASPVDSYFLQLDISKYYYSIRHDVLQKGLLRRLKDEQLVNLIMMQCRNDNGIGLNVGAMISQLMGAFYLDRFDQYVKRVLKVKRYIRYVDDMVFIGLSKKECCTLKAQAEKFLQEELGLSFSKAIIRPLKAGINFVGFRTWHTKRLVRKYCLHNLSRSLNRQKTESIQAILAHARNTASYKHMLNKTLCLLDAPNLNNIRGVVHDDLLLQRNNNAGASRHNI